MGSRDAATHSAPLGRTALVVEDDRTSQLLLKTLLVKEGYEVVTAANGVEAVAQFERHAPGIVFMDIIMPEMNGYEATRRIKARAGDRFVPVIFLTAISDEDALAECVAAGGDDFLTKPYRRTVLRARITAVERIRKLYHRVHSQREELRILHERMQTEQEIAEKIFSRAVTRGSVSPELLKVVLRPSATFNGDLLLTARRPSGGVNFLLGDFTGHGLAAAIGALPVSEVFRAMTAKGFAAPDILREANRKLKTLLPTNIFMAASLVSLDEDARSALVWNGGMPDVLILGEHGGIRQRLPSAHLPLGIRTELGDEAGCERVELDPRARILLCSDGVLEARNQAGEMFGQDRYEAALATPGGTDLCDRAVAALDEFTGGLGQDDDASLVEIPCDPDLLRGVLKPRPRRTGGDASRGNGTWRWAVSVHGARLRTVDPVPLAIGQMLELQDLHHHREPLYAVLSELYSNALEHGVLGLDSQLKRSADGFEEYYAERERRLEALTHGHVRIQTEHMPAARGGRLRICVEDSGEGFVPGEQHPLATNRSFSGRGLPLVESLCESLHFEGCGNRVTAIYAWD